MLHNIVDLVDLESAEATVPKDKIEQLDAIKKSPGGIKLTERVVKQTYQYAARSVDYDLPFLDSAVCGEYEELDSYLQNGISEKDLKRIVSLLEYSQRFNVLLHIMQLSKLMENRVYKLFDHANILLMAACDSGNVDLVEVLLKLENLAAWDSTMLGKRAKEISCAEKITSLFSNSDTISFFDLIINYQNLLNKGYNNQFLDRSYHTMLSLPFFLFLMTAIAAILTIRFLKFTPTEWDKNYRFLKVDSC